MISQESLSQAARTQQTTEINVAREHLAVGPSVPAFVSERLLSPSRQ